MDEWMPTPGPVGPPPPDDARSPHGPHGPGWGPPPGYGQHPGTWYPPPGSPSAPPGSPPAPPGYLPPGWGGGQPPTPPGPLRRAGAPARRRGGAAGGLVAALIAIIKYGLAFGKFGFTFVSMAVAVVAYALFFGWAIAIGIVILIFIHEMGHFLVSRALGVPMSAPVFVPFLGAFTQAGQGFQRSRSTEAVIAAAGPVFGFAASLAVFAWAALQPGLTQGAALAYALSYFGFFITLFNLIPAVPFDGGRVASAISKWFNVVGLVIFGAILLAMAANVTAFNPFLLLFFLFACYSVWNRFKAARLGGEAPPLPVATRVAIGTAYIALVALSGLFMSLSNASIQSLVGTGAGRF
jgi:Zn-dependent protease